MATRRSSSMMDAPVWHPEGIEAAKVLSSYLRDLGLRVRDARTRRGMNQQELADLAGIDRTHLSAIECGKQNTTIRVVVNIAVALSVPVHKLLIG